MSSFCTGQAARRAEATAEGGAMWCRCWSEIVCGEMVGWLLCVPRGKLITSTAGVKHKRRGPRGRMALLVEGAPSSPCETSCWNLDLFGASLFLNIFQQLAGNRLDPESVLFLLMQNFPVLRNVCLVVCCKKRRDGGYLLDPPWNFLFFGCAATPCTVRVLLGIWRIIFMDNFTDDEFVQNSRLLQVVAGGMLSRGETRTSW